MWGLGKAYGEINLGGNSGLLFNAWIPDVWNSYCFRLSNKTKTFQAFLNNEEIFQTETYGGEHMNRFTSLLLLNGVYQDTPLHGALTDLRVWNSNISTESNKSERL